MTSATPSLWRPVLDPEWVPPEEWHDAPPFAAAGRLAGLVSPALAAHLLAPLSATLGRDLIDPGEARRSLLMNRLTGGAQRTALGTVADSGIPVVCMKGFALAHAREPAIYPDPDLRTIGDLDLLVGLADLDPLIGVLSGAGYAFAELPTARWGFISDASFMPMVSPDGICNIDLHIAPDCYPAHRSLTTARLFAAARTADAGGIALRVPAPEHALLLSLTNAAKDKFGPFGVRKLLDAGLLLRACGGLDWQEVRSLAREGHFLGPARVALALLVRLGLPAELVPPDLRRVSGLLARPVLGRLAADHESMFAEAPSALRVLLREFTVCTETDVALRNALRRLRGLFRPASGLPPGVASRR